MAAVAVLVMGAVSAITTSPATQGAKFGGLGSAHVHAAFVLKIENHYIDFSNSQYQVKSPYIHVENGVGTTLHKHATDAPFGEFLKSVGMSISENGCFVLLTDGAGEKAYCPTDGKKLRFFVNEVDHPPSSIMGYVLQDNDRFLVIYGDQTADEIKQELQRLKEIPIFKNEVKQ